MVQQITDTVGWFLARPLTSLSPHTRMRPYCIKPVYFLKRQSICIFNQTFILLKCFLARPPALSPRSLQLVYVPVVRADDDAVGRDAHPLLAHPAAPRAALRQPLQVRRVPGTRSRATRLAHFLLDKVGALCRNIGANLIIAMTRVSMDLDFHRD